jgi:outer membrane protein assembly factor BamB
LSGNGRILVGSYDAVMHCLDSQSGTAVWTFATESFINGAPAVNEKYVVFGGCDMHVYVISLADGSQVAAVPLESYIAGSIALSGSKAFLGHYGDAIVCVDIESTNVVWQYSDPDDSAPFFSSPAVADDIIVAGSRDYRVHCVDRKSGKKKWTVQTKGDVDSSPVICGQSVFAASLDGRIYRIDRDSGNVTWSYEIGSPISGSPGIADGILIIGAEDGRVYAFGKKTQVPK